MSILSLILLGIAVAVVLIALCVRFGWSDLLGDLFDIVISGIFSIGDQS